MKTDRQRHADLLAAWDAVGGPLNPWRAVAHVELLNEKGESQGIRLLRNAQGEWVLEDAAA